MSEMTLVRLNWIRVTPVESDNETWVNLDLVNRMEVVPKYQVGPITHFNATRLIEGTLTPLIVKESPQQIINEAHIWKINNEPQQAQPEVPKDPKQDTIDKLKSISELKTGEKFPDWFHNYHSWGEAVSTLCKEAARLLEQSHDHKH